MLRLVNAALNDELFFSVANHTLTVVEVDAVYVMPFTVRTLVISPGQTTNVLLATKPAYPRGSSARAASSAMLALTCSPAGTPHTLSNPKGLCAVSQQPESIVLVCPGAQKG